jgi:hypothetical protein
VVVGGDDMSEVTIKIEGEITGERYDLEYWVRCVDELPPGITHKLAALLKDGLAKIPKMYPLDLHVELTPEEARDGLYLFGRRPISQRTLCSLYDKLQEIAEKE